MQCGVAAAITALEASACRSGAQRGREARQAARRAATQLRSRRPPASAGAANGSSGREFQKLTNEARICEGAFWGNVGVN
jgi:hypothetical protein